jgi:hypothetical protein
MEQIDESPYRNDRPAKIERTGCMVLHPLAEIGIGMFVAVRIGSSQFMMDILRNRKRGNCEQQQDQRNG